MNHTSIKCYFAAVRHLQIENDGGDPRLPAMPKLDFVLRGIKSGAGHKSLEP